MACSCDDRRCAAEAAQGNRHRHILDCACSDVYCRRDDVCCRRDARWDEGWAPRLRDQAQG
ncbi:MAG: hypothetical protein C4297_14490 [Gemmataceae bacterium]